MPTILVADDEPLLRAGLRSILEAEPGYVVVGEAADGVDAIHQTLRLRPEVVLMDVRMPHLDGIEATRRLRDAGCPARILVMTTFDLDEYALRAMRAGATGFVIKASSPAQLVDAVRTVVAGGAPLDPAVADRLADHILDGSAERG